MTVRAIVWGLLGTLLMGAYGQYAGKYVPGMWGFVRGYLPISAYGLLVFYVAFVNPLLGRLRKSWRLRPAEMALIVAMILLGCGIADSGMMRYFPRQLVHPLVLERANPAWQKLGLLDYTPPAMLVNDGKYSVEVVEDFVSPMWNYGDEIPFRRSPPYGLWKRLTSGERPPGTVTWGVWIKTFFGRAISIGRVPWHAWWKPLLLWSGVIGLTMVAVVALSLVVHRQWAERERIRYPLAELASSLLRQDGQGRILITRDRLFWIGLAVPFLIRLVNGLYLWFPNSIEIPLSVDLAALNQAFPEFMKTPGASLLATPTIFPACVGLTYLLASDIGFSLGFIGIASVAVMHAVMHLGVNLSGSMMTGGVQPWYSFGASLAMGVMLLWIGRAYYWHTLKAAVTFRPQPETDASAVRACRVCAGALALAVVLLTLAGMDPLMAALGMLLIMLLYLLVTRINAETGLFFFGLGWAVPSAVVGLFGIQALGPAVLICLGTMKYLLHGDVEQMMPFVATGLKVTSDAGLKPGRSALLFGAAILLTVAVAVPTALWADYNHAAALRRGGNGSEIYDTAGTVVNELSQSGKLEESLAYGPVERIAQMRPSRLFWTAAGIGFGLLLLCSALRMRYSWWPLHPVAMLFVFGGLGRFAISFLGGWAIKAGVMKYGGGSLYTRVKPMMLGVVVGDLAGGFLFLVVSYIYYACTGLSGKAMLLW
jgi:hypothetical protein